MENPIFIVGLRRSGSTLWLNIFAANQNIFRMGEMELLTPWRKDFRYFLQKQVGDLSNEKNIDKMLELMFSSEKVPGITGPFWYTDIKRKLNDPNLKKRISNRLLGSDKSLNSIIKILIEEITYFKGHNRCCIKFPVYVNHVPELLQWYPGCKIIHIIRDPRAIAISKTNDPGGTARIINKFPYLKFIIRKMMLFFVIIQYIWTSRLHLKFKGIENYALFKYEDLLVDPERVIKELCEFTKIDYVPEMLNPQHKEQKGQTSSVTGERYDSFNKKAAIHWKNVISPFEERVITLLTKSSMRRFGYDPEIHPIFHKTR